MVKKATRHDTATRTQVRIRTNLQMLMAEARWKGTTQRVIARQAGINPAQFSQVLRAHRPVTLAAVEALAPLFGRTAEEIVQCDLTRLHDIPPLAHRSEFPHDQTQITDQHRADLYAAVRLIFQEVEKHDHRPAVHRAPHTPGAQNDSAHAQRKPGA